MVGLNATACEASIVLVERPLRLLVDGATVGIGAHPHAAHWEQLGGLCVDGSRWSLAKANELRTHGSASRAKGPGFTPIGDAGEAASTAAAGVGGGASEENAAAEDDSEDDSLVE